MCQRCVEVVMVRAAEHGFEELTGDQVDRFLWNCTCFPFGDPEMVAANADEAFAWLAEMETIESFDVFLSFAIGRCETELAEQMQKLGRTL